MTLFHIDDEELEDIEFLGDRPKWADDVNDDWVEDDDFMSFLYTMYCDE